MSVTEEIRTSLQTALSPDQLDVVDDSESHRGHAGHTGSGESHFNVMIRSAAFDGKNRLQRHRMVHAALGPDLIGRIHALALDLDTP